MVTPGAAVHARPRAAVRRRPSAARRARGRAGYNLVILVMIFTAMSILAASALPAISQMIRRNKEEELIFRGFQYAEAIRVFQRRYSRYPVRLEELIEVKPRCIRQLWKDPMTDGGAWGLVTANNGPARRPPGQPSQNPAPPEGVGDGGDNATDAEPGQPRENQPILGVVSKRNHASIKMLFGRTNYSEWRFTVETLQTPFGVGPGGRISRAANATWIGRPFRQGLAQPGGGPGSGAPPQGGPANRAPHPELGLPVQPPAKGGPNGG